MQGKRFYINCRSEYFKTKHGDPAIIVIEDISSLSYNPPTFLYQGRVLAEGRLDMLSGTIYYGHIKGLGEFVHESELGNEVLEDPDTTSERRLRQC